MPGVLAASRALASPAAPGGRPFGLPLTRLRAPGLAALTFRGRAPEHPDKATPLSVLTTEGAAVAILTDRDEQITRFYLDQAERLRRAIAHKTCGLDNAIIDDACAFAWETLLGRQDIDLDRHEAYWWLYKVALREAWALGRRQRREQPVGGMNGADEDSLEPVDLDSDVGDVVAERVEHASMREVLGRLHWRERRELALFAYGLSYEEIATVTDTSYAAVNRWMARGRNALRAADTRRHLSDGEPDAPAR